MSDVIPKIDSYLTLDQVVASYMNERHEKTLTRYESYLQMAIEGFSDINMFEMNTIDTTILDVDPLTKVAKLPTDYIAMRRIGILIHGKLWTLTENPDIILPMVTELCGEEIVTDPNANATDFTNSFGFPYLWGGLYVSAFYAQGGGRNIAYYRIDLNNRTVIFNGNLLDKPVYLEYKSSGIKGATSFVPRQALNALKAYIHYANTRHDFRYGLGERQEAERRYNIELYSLKRLENGFTFDQYLDNFYSTTGQSIKR